MTAARRCFILLVCGLTAAPGELRAGHLPQAVSTTPIAAVADVLPEVNDSARDARRQPVFTIGVMVLLGITLTGLGMLAVVIVWGHRVRRRSRAPLPDASRGDELFYLKSRKNSGPDTTVLPPGRSSNSE